MKFLIQKYKGKVVHDFSFTLLESIQYLKWSANGDVDIKVKYLDYIDAENENWNFWFNPYHQHYIPVGSVEFVTAWFKHFHDHTPRPINVPEDLWGHAGRTIWNGDENGYKKGYGQLFVKSNDHIKGFKLLIKEDYPLPKGNYQFSEEVGIDSEWRAFVYQGKLVGLQNYGGDFTAFPDVQSIYDMIQDYDSAPVAYTLDVGVTWGSTFVIEVHDFFSCGLYGFADHRILPFMHSRWHYEYLKNTVYGK